MERYGRLSFIGCCLPPFISAMYLQTKGKTIDIIVILDEYDMREKMPAPHPII